MRSPTFSAQSLHSEASVRPSRLVAQPIDTTHALRASRTLSAPHRRALCVSAQALNKGGPPDVPKPRDQPKGGKEWLQSIFSRFGPVKEKASNTTVLDFEKPLVELDNRIKEVGFFFSILCTPDPNHPLPIVHAHSPICLTPRMITHCCSPFAPPHHTHNRFAKSPKTTVSTSPTK